MATHDNAINENECDLLAHTLSTEKRAKELCGRKCGSTERVRESCVKLPALHRDDDDELALMLPLQSATFTAFAIVGAVATSCIHSHFYLSLLRFVCT